jgi:hypothetical protein
MRDCLCVSVYHSDKGDAEFGTPRERFFHFTGDFLMQCLQDRANGLETQYRPLAPQFVNASEDDPLMITKHEHWVKVWSTLKKGGQPARETDSYFRIGGRTIQRIRAGSGGFADGFYMIDLLLSGRGADVWRKKEGASYKDFADFFRKNGGSMIEKSEAIADDLRKILTAPTTNYGACLASDVKSALPMLAAAMFIAEPARNPRAFIVGIMVLDMVGRVYNTDLNQTKFYTLDKVFAHPARISMGLANQQKGPQVIQEQGRYGKTVDRVINPYAAQTTDPVYVEGKVPGVAQVIFENRSDSESGKRLHPKEGTVDFVALAGQPTEQRLVKWMSFSGVSVRRYRAGETFNRPIHTSRSNREGCSGFGKRSYQEPDPKTIEHIRQNVGRSDLFLVA